MVRVEESAGPEIAELVAPFCRSLRSAHKSAKTIELYSSAVRMLDTYLHAHAMPTTVGAIRREHIEEHINDILANRSPAYAANRYRSLQQFFRWWCEGEMELAESPMKRMHPPKVVEPPTAVLTLEQIATLLKTCDGKDFTSRRDRAIILLLYDTGMRRGELAGLLVESVDMDLQTATVLGKGRKQRVCPFGNNTAQTLDRYLRVRRQHPNHERPWLWLGRSGRLTDSGVTQALNERVAQAGLPHIHPHQFRHSAAHEWLAAGGNETDAMRLFGWSSRQMLQRYGASAADARAREAYKRLSPADRL